MTYLLWMVCQGTAVDYIDFLCKSTNAEFMCEIYDQFSPSQKKRYQTAVYEELYNMEVPACIIRSLND